MKIGGPTGEELAMNQTKYVLNEIMKTSISIFSYFLHKTFVFRVQTNDVLIL